MNNKDIVENEEVIKLLKEIQEVQNEFAIYGVEFDDDSANASLKLAIKFSLPEFYEIEHAGINTENLKSLVKNKMKQIMFKLWKITTPDITDDELEACWKFIAVLARVRKGETWTQENVTEVIKKNNEKLEKAIELVENPYEEV